MGCSKNDTYCEDDETPSHMRTISSFSIASTEITQAMYFSVVGENPSAFSDCDLCPVEKVSWQEAQTFCETIDARLPTEAEWEYAARATSQTIYGCGDFVDCLAATAWFLDNGSGRSQIVGLKNPNNFGLYDMFGNVAEWVSDCYHTSFNGSPPSNESEWIDDSCSNDKVVRGCSWQSNYSDLRASNRDSRTPTFKSATIGFRCVRENN